MKKTITKVNFKEIVKKNLAPKITMGGNIQLGNTSTFGVWSTLKGNEYINIKKLNGSVQGTCGEYCKNCSKECYVNHSYRYGSVLYRHALNALWIKNDLHTTFYLLSKQLERKKKPFDIIRINQSGELTSPEELQEWNNLALKNPKTIFYVYTKNYNAVKELIKMKKIAKNLTVLISIWHDQGVKEYEEMKDCPNIKAFVYDDGVMNIKSDTQCMAYAGGKLNHNITCEKCKKCFDRNNSHKVISCKSH